MPYSKIDICNLALASLGADAIRSFDEKNKRARMSSNFFNATRDYLLSRFDWSFARKFTLLKEVSLPVGEFLPTGMKAYELPSDCRTPRDLHPPGSRDAWMISQNKLYTNKTGNIYLYYTAQEIDTALYTDTFSNLMALGIAVRMGPAITQDKSLTKLMYEQYMQEQRDCWETDANIGEDYRAHDEDPNNDTFVHPEGYFNSEDSSRFLETE